MAITIHQQPSAHSAIGSKLVIVASSTNSGNDGFKYVVRVQLPELADVQPIEFIVSANANEFLVFDLQSTIKPYCRSLPIVEEGSEKGVHANYVFTEDLASYPESVDGLVGVFISQGFIVVNVHILEGYDVDGVFTIDEDTYSGVSTAVYNFNDFDFSQGVNPSVLTTIGHENGDWSRIMSDRLPTTHARPCDLELGIGLGNVIYIPAYESDWGNWTIRQYEDVTGSSDQARKLLLSVLPNSGPPTQATYSLPNKGQYSHMPIWPANLNASTIVGIPKPQDYPNWKAIYFQILNASDEQSSMTYVMYNAARYGKCVADYEVIKLAWVGRRGGWEYFNFTKDSFVEYATEKKIVSRVIGNYGDVSNSIPFSFNSFDESEIVTDLAINKFLNASSDWIQNGEREFLKGLFLSKQVHWVQDDGSHIPVIVQSDGYQVKKVYGGQPLFKLDIKVKIAQEQFN
jgi:hypothetical protein